MGHKTDHAIALARYYLNRKQLSKLFLQPQRVPGAISHFSKKVSQIFYDVKLNRLSAENELEIAQKSMIALATLACANRDLLPTNSIEELFSFNVHADEDCKLLGNFFAQHGSDKSTVHNYHLVYGALLKSKQRENLNILEIGLGTNNIDVLSNMGLEGKPGASLRAFRDMYKNAQIVGADIDRRVLFQEDRIRTYFVDQTNPESLEELSAKLANHKFDLIIDDGLHNSQANLNTLNFALGLLKDDGIFIVEDIRNEDKTYYQVASSLVSLSYKLQFVKTKIGHIAIVKKKI